MEVFTGTDGMAFGLAGSRPQIAGKFVSATRQAVLQEWPSHYGAAPPPLATRYFQGSFGMPRIR